MLLGIWDRPPVKNSLRGFVQSCVNCSDEKPRIRKEMIVQTLGLTFGYFCAGFLVFGVLYLIYHWLFTRKAVNEQRGWYPEGPVLRRKDRSIVYEGDPVVSSAAHSTERHPARANELEMPTIGRF